MSCLLEVVMRPRINRVHEVTPETLRRLLAGKRPILVKFWSPDCPHCASFAPAVEGAADVLDTLVTVVSMSVEDDANAKIAGEYDVDAIPALVLVIADTAYVRVGTDTKRGIVSWVRGQVKKPNKS